MPYQKFSNPNHKLLLLAATLLVFLHTSPTLAQQPPPSNQDYASPISTKAIIVVVAIVILGIITCFLRQIITCCGTYVFGGTAQGISGVDNDELRTRNIARRGGLDPTTIATIPTFLYSDVKAHKSTPLECAICLNEFVDHEHLRLLHCNHVFHPPCIGQWVASNITCPVCRANLEIPLESQSQPNSLAQVLQQPSRDEFQPSDQITQPHRGDHDQDHRDVVVHVGDADAHNSTIKSPIVNEISVNYEPINIIPRSHSTGHSLVENYERFTLKLPEEIRKKMVNVNNTTTTGLRSRRSVSLSIVPSKPDLWRFTMSPPFISRSGSNRSAESSNNIAGIKRSPRSLFNLLKSPVKSPLNRVVRCDEIGERSSDKLWPNNNTTSQELELEEYHHQLFG